MRKSNGRGQQLSLVVRKKPGKRGGTRPGAGRPRKPGAVPHDRRPKLLKGIPQHVTLRVVFDAPNLGREYLMKVIRAAIRESQKPDFRVVEFNVLSNHAHFITEADNVEALSRGVQGLEVRIARRLNSALKRKGKLFPLRFHARYLKTPREVRNCLRYVLLNRKHHAAEKKFAKYWVDPCSSGAWFDGWSAPIRVDTEWMRDLVTMDSPGAKAQTWLLRVGWRKHGLIAVDERPA